MVIIYCMKVFSVTEIAEKWGLTARRVRMLCAEGKIEGSYLVGNTWNIPEGAKKPVDGRGKSGATAKVNTIEVIDKLKRQIDKCRPLTQGEYERLNEEFLVEFTHNSNAIEGNTLTLRETALVLQGVTIDQKPLKDHMEAIGHRDAFYYVLDIVKNKEQFTETTIKKIHSLVLMDKPDDRGVYRKMPVTIGGSMYTPPQPYLVGKQMEALMLRANEWQKTKHITEFVALFHLNFESIHPFIDGNGRTGRLILNLMLIQQGYSPINIKFSNRQKYYNCFEDFHKTNNPNAMTKLVAKLLEEEMKKSLAIRLITDTTNRMLGHKPIDKARKHQAIKNPKPIEAGEYNSVIEINGELWYYDDDDYWFDDLDEEMFVEDKWGVYAENYIDEETGKVCKKIDYAVLIDGFDRPSGNWRQIEEPLGYINKMIESGIYKLIRRGE